MRDDDAPASMIGGVGVRMSARGASLTIATMKAAVVRTAIHTAPPVARRATRVDDRRAAARTRLVTVRSSNQRLRESQQRVGVMHAHRCHPSCGSGWRRYICSAACHAASARKANPVGRYRRRGNPIAPGGLRFLARFQEALVLHPSERDVDGAALQASLRQLDHLQAKQLVVGRQELNDHALGGRKLRKLLVHANDYRSYKQ